MKRQIFNVLFALVLVLNFSLVLSVPAAADGGTPTFNNPDYFYKRLLDTGVSGPRWPDYNAIAGKICWYETGYKGYFADYDANALELTNVTAFATDKDVYITTFSKDGQYIYYQDVADAHMTSLDVTGGTIKAYPAYRYSIDAGTHELIFDISTIPADTIEALTDYIGNEFGFYLGPGGSNNEVLMCVRDGNGQMDIVSYNIPDKTFVNLTDSAQAEYDGRYFGTDTSQLLYWTESYPGHYDRSVAILSSSGETVIDTETTPDMYLSSRWGEDQNHVMAMKGTGWSSNDLVMFTKNGGVWSGPEDLTGDAWSATDGGLNVGAWVGNGFIFSVRNSDGNSSNGLWVAMLPADEVWVDDNWAGYNSGDPADGHTFGYDAFATIQDGIDAVAGSTVHVAEGTYNETVTLKSTTASNISIIGENKATTFITGGICFEAAYQGLKVQNFTITGNGYLLTETYEATVSCHWSGHYPITNLEFSNCIFDGEGYNDGKGGRCGVVLKRLGGVVKFENNEFKDYRGWATLDVNDGSGGGPLTVLTYTFNNNNVHDNWGSCALRGNPADRTDTVTVTGNTFDNNGNSAAGFWAALEINEADNINVSNNTFTNTHAGSWGEGEALQFWHIASLTVTQNHISANYQGIYFPGGAWASDLSLVHINYNNIYGNTQFGIKAEIDNTGTIDAENNWWGHASGPSGPDGRVNKAGKTIGEGDAIYGPVDCDPWLPQPVFHTKRIPVPPGLE